MDVTLEKPDRHVVRLFWSGHNTTLTILQLLQARLTS